MFNEIVKERTIDDAWLKWWEIAKDNLSGIDSRDGSVVWECINATTVIKDPTYNFSHNPIRDMSVRYAMGEMLWYDMSTDKLAPMQLYTKNWDRMSDDGVTVNSNYGYVTKEQYGFDQYEYCFDLLKDSPETRQAVVHIKTPRDTRVEPTKDLNCTICQQFFIRDGKLHSTVYMRSNDLWFGFPYDVLFFTMRQIEMAMKLGNVEIGTYTHIAGSLHLYERDYKRGKENE